MLSAGQHDMTRFQQNQQCSGMFELVSHRTNPLNLQELNQLSKLDIKLVSAHATRACFLSSTTLCHQQQIPVHSEVCLHGPCISALQPLNVCWPLNKTSLQLMTTGSATGEYSLVTTNRCHACAESSFLYCFAEQSETAVQSADTATGVKEAGNHGMSLSSL